MKRLLLIALIFAFPALYAVITRARPAAPAPRPAVDLWAAKYGVDPAFVAEVKAVRWDVDLGIWIPRNQAGRFVNIRDGYRVTVGQPTHYTHSVYLFGNSEVFGTLVKDNETIASALQRLMPSARIVNVGITGAAIQSQIARLRTLRLYPGDVVVFVDGVQDVERVYFGEAKKAVLESYQAPTPFLFRQPVAFSLIEPERQDVYADVYPAIPGVVLNIPETDFLDFAHTNAQGNQLIARAIYDQLTIY